MAQKKGARTYEMDISHFTLRKLSLKEVSDLPRLTRLINDRTTVGAQRLRTDLEKPCGAVNFSLPSPTVFEHLLRC